MADKEEGLRLLRESLNNNQAEFRTGQWDAIDSIVNRSERRLVVERTGWGKSSVYFIATKLLRNAGRGPTLIISPLLALMRNQVAAAEALGVTARSLNSSNIDDWNNIIAAVRENRIDALLVSPERLANESFMRNVLAPISQTIGLMVVDEAHCISDWGHDFRPDYRRLVNILQNMPETLPILGTTATANHRVIDDIQAQLGNVEVQRGSLIRESLALQTFELPTQGARLAWMAQNIPNIPGTGIIYTLTKRDANQVADWLNENNIEARAYYSGVECDGFEDSGQYRQHLEGLLLDNEIKVLVATTSLGMGYDKPDLGFVIHYQAPGSIIAYYQQVGRAGRAINSAYGFLLSGSEDEDIHAFFRKSAFPRQEWVQSILELLEEHEGLTIREIESFANLRNGQIQQVLKFLSVENPSPILKIGSKWIRTPNDYNIDLEKIRRLTLQRHAEWEEVKSFINEDGCLMQYLAAILDDENPQACGKCENCLGRPIFTPSVQHEIGVAASKFLLNSEMDLNCMKQVAPNSFPQYGFSGNLPPDLRALPGRTLSRYGDAGWGNIVKRDKNAGHLSQELANAVVEMVVERWNPNPTPAWVTCVPSIKQPNLVSDFANLVASKLGIPFHPAVRKITNNQPQKNQENRFHQCNNLDGVFEVDNISGLGPVLLIDDVVDSKWTMTIVSALLLRAGCSAVLPLALASASVGG